MICANDLLAVGVLRTFRIEGVRVPEDVAVTGYDDSPFADVVEPRLTTIRQPLGALGQEAVRFIISAIESPGSPRRELRLLPELIVRESSGQMGRRARAEVKDGKSSERTPRQARSSALLRGKKAAETRVAPG